MIWRDVNDLFRLLRCHYDNNSVEKRRNDDARRPHGDRIQPSRARYAIFFVGVAHDHHAFSLFGGHEHDAIALERTPHLITGRFVDTQLVLGLETSECGQRYSGLVGKRLLIPTK